MTSICSLACNQQLRKTVPANYIWLSIATLCEASFICALSARLEPKSVVIVICAFAVITSGLFVAAMCTPTLQERPRIYRNLIIGLFISLVLQLVFSLVFLLFFGIEWWLVGLSALVVIISGVYIIFDLKMILERGETDPEDYIMAALILYFDLMRLFYHLLIIFG